MNGTRISWLLPALLALFAGCSEGVQNCPKIEIPESPTSVAEYVLAEYRLADAAAQEPLSDISTTAEYERLRPRLKKVVLRLPPECNDSELCARWSNKLEAAFTAVGYEVLAVDMRDREAQEASYKQDAARGADAVIEFHAIRLEQTTSEVSIKGSLKYFASDASGAPLKPKPLDKETRTRFKQVTQEVLVAMQARADSPLAVTLDVRAVRPSTQKPIWFFQRAAKEKVAALPGIRVLFGRYTGEPWKSVAPTGAIAASSPKKSEPSLVSEEVVGGAAPPKPNPFLKRVDKLIASNAAAVAQAFKKGEDE